jgi:hypothetical protein
MYELLAFVTVPLREHSNSTRVSTASDAPVVNDHA